MVSVVDTTSLISAGINKSTSLSKTCSMQRRNLIQPAYKSDDRLPLRSNAVWWSCTHARTHTHTVEVSLTIHEYTVIRESLLINL